MFTAVQNKRVFEEVLEQLKRLIRAGKLVPGNRLPPERELAEMLGVSRASLRVALRLLEALGAVSSKPGGGTVLQEPRLDRVFLSLGAFLFIDDTTYRESYEVRCMLEGQTARLAAQRATAADLEEIKRWHDILTTSDDVAVLTDADFRFHHAIARASHNSALCKVWEFSAGLFGESMWRTRQWLFEMPAAAERIARQHHELYVAICARDPDRAEKAMAEHLTYAASEVLASEQKMDGGDSRP